MPVDLAVDWNSGDLLIAPNGDIDLRSGQSTVDQRIRVRLKIVQGSWILDPTNGTLGSHLLDALRMPMDAARVTIPLMVKEALEPMEDISVVDVLVKNNADNIQAFDITILYTEDGSDDVQTTDLTIAG